MKEIEIAYVLDETIEKAQKKLKELKQVKKEKIRDTYFYDPSKKSSKPFRNNMGECLRIRTINKEHTVEYKIDKFDEEGHWEASDKYGVKVDDIRSTLEKFNESNLKELVTLEKEIIVYKKGEYEILLEDIKGLGNFFEINYLGKETDDVNDVKEEMKKLAESFGLKIEDTIKIGKPEMMLKKLGIHIK